MVFLQLVWYDFFMDEFSEKLFNSLIKLKIIDENKLNEVYEESKINKTSFSELLLTKDLISDLDLGKTIADILGFPFISLAKVTIPDSAIKILPEEFADTHKAIVFDETADSIKIALVNPQDKRLIESIIQKTNKKITPYYATIRDIEKSFSIYKKDLQKTFDELLNEQISTLSTSEDKEAPIIKIVDLLIEYAYSNGASDIHIEPETDQSTVRFRIDGVMRDVLHFPLDIHKQVIARIKVMASLQTDEHFSAQDGKIHTDLGAEKLDIRVSIVPLTHGEKAVLRLLASYFRQFGLSDLGMSAKDLEKVNNAIKKPYGMILSTGPTGSGKTTTMYAILKILNTRDRNIATIEDPVEYDIEGVNQIQVNEKTNLTFVEGLRSILRQDPNIIYVGEIRDAETADIAINSALTGHILLSTLHTNDAATAIPRLIDLGIEPFLVGSTLIVIVAQRLVRRICESCKFSELTLRADLEKHFPKELIQNNFGTTEQIRIYKGKGCPICHKTGYVGRIGIFEILEINERIQKFIETKADSDAITKAAIDSGMTIMMQDGLAKVQQGITTIEEVLRATTE